MTADMLEKREKMLNGRSLEEREELKRERGGMGRWDEKGSPVLAIYLAEHQLMIIFTINQSSDYYPFD